MGKLRSVHLIEALVWLTIAAIFFIYSFEFNQTIEIYKFGATAWPRSILLMLVLVIVGNLFYQKANGSEAQPGRVGIAEDNIDDANKSVSSFLNIGSFLILPLILFLPGVFKKNIRVMQWLSLFVWFYICEALVRISSDPPETIFYSVICLFLALLLTFTTWIAIRKIRNYRR